LRTGLGDAQCGTQGQGEGNQVLVHSHDRAFPQSEPGITKSSSRSGTNSFSKPL
jgi:hypothetical protein